MSRSIITHQTLAVPETNKPKNLIYVAIKNSFHETAGDMSAVVGSIDFVAIAKVCGYANTVWIVNFDNLD